MGNEATFRATPTPIRHSLRTYTPQEIAALNEELGRKGVAAFRPAEELLADISAGKQPTRTSAPGWFYHPDERVQLALLEREELTPVPSFNFYADKNFRLLAIWAVAYARASSEGVVWTPILDYISSQRGYWPLRTPATRVLGSKEFADSVPARLRGGLYYRIEMEQAELLSSWIRGGGSERIDLLLRFRSDEFVGPALRSVRRISPTRLRRILEERPALGPRIAIRAGELSKSVRNALKEWAFADLLRAEGRLATLPAAASDWDRRSLAYGGGTLQHIGRSWPKLGSQTFTSAELERLLELLEVVGEGTVISPSRVAARTLLTCVAMLDETALLRLVPHLENRSEEVVTLVFYATHATPAVWVRCLEQCPTAGVQDAVSQRPEALKSPEVRHLLRKSSRRSVLNTLLHGATGEEFAQLFRKLVRQDLDDAAHALREEPERARFLTKNDLLPLLESTEQGHRLLAITLMSNAVVAEPRLAKARA